MWLNESQKKKLMNLPFSLVIKIPTRALRPKALKLVNDSWLLNSMSFGEADSSRAINRKSHNVPGVLSIKSYRHVLARPRYLSGSEYLVFA